jgi:hypothetical protein
MYGDSPRLRDESFPGEVGHALHAGFQNYMTFKDENRAQLAMMLRYPHNEEFAESKNHATRSLEACYATLDTMIKSPVPDKYQLVRIKHDGIEKPAVEVPFAIELLNTGLPMEVWFVGFIDAILLKLLDNTIGVNDIKTTRQHINDMSARYEYDEQTVPYGMLLECLLNRVIDQFVVSYLSVFVDLMDPKAVMYEYTKTRDHVGDWVRGLAADLRRIKWNLEHDWWPRATNGEVCMSFNKGCQFLEMCAFRDIKMITRMIQGNPREALFHDGKEPWVTVQLDMKGYM